MNLPAVTRADWAERINARWQTSHTAILETGRLIAAAKDALEKKDFEAMLAADLRCGASTARRLMIVAADDRLSDRAHVHKLPNHWGTLYELTKVDDETFEAKLADGTIRPDMERGDVARIRKAAFVDARRAPVEGGGTIADLRDLVDGGHKFSCIYADPPWPYQTWSEKGEDRSAGQHYDTMSIDDITDLPVRALAADNCILHLWVISTLVPEALAILSDGWGFDYKKIGFIWTKTVNDGSARKMGNGKWTRDEAEVCLLATRGKPERLDAGVRQTLDAPLGDHSEKPDEFRARIQRLTAGPYLELFGRKDVPGWTVWGNQVRWRAPLAPHDPDTGEIFEDRAVVALGATAVERALAARAVDESAAPTQTQDAGGGGPIAVAVPPASTSEDLEIPTFMRRGHPDCVVPG